MVISWCNAAYNFTHIKKLMAASNWVELVDAMVVDINPVQLLLLLVPTRAFSQTCASLENIFQRV
jgi:hypothetical protein